MNQGFKGFKRILEPLAQRIQIFQIITKHTNIILKIIERFEKICEISVTK